MGELGSIGSANVGSSSANGADSRDGCQSLAGAGQPTVLVDSFREAAQTDEVHPNAYRGLRIHALPGLHELVGDLAQQHLPAGARVLDLAAGSGAMCLRLRDLGFEVSATDYVDSNFRLAAEVPFVQADLNAPFASLFPQRFEAIVASEIIEHLENPRHFARECFALLRPGGHLVLTTPNIESWASKTLFVRGGRHVWFSDADYLGHGHISPLSQWQLERCFAEAGFAVVHQCSHGDGLQQLAGSPRLMMLGRLIRRLTQTSQALGGEIFVAVLRKP